MNSSLVPYLIVDRPVPGFGCELIVLGFETIIPLQEGNKENMVKTKILQVDRSVRFRYL
jgi:hypothetical protein